MHVMRNEPYSLRVEPDGSVKVPGGLIKTLLGTERFAPGSIVVANFIETDSGRGVELTADQREEVKVPSGKVQARRKS